VVAKIGTSPTLFELKEHSKTNLTITGTNLSEKKCEYFNHATHPSMRVIDCVRISCAIPLLMESVRYNGSVYVDGGLMDNFPLKYATSVYPTDESVTGICVRFQCPSVPVDSFVDFIRELTMVCLMKLSDQTETHGAEVYLIEPVTYVQLYDYVTLSPSKRSSLFSMLFEDGRLQTKRTYLNKLIVE
jgi:predicted acylesterase/phospholipase RssA